MVAVVVGALAVVPARADQTCGVSPTVASSTAPVGVDHCDGLRPGAKIDSSWVLGGTSPVERAASGCTANFVFTDPSGRRYMGTAGHCFLWEGTTERVFPDEQRIITQNLKRVGYLVYGVYESPERDFALFRVDDDVPVDAAMAYWGGPTAIYRSHAASPTLLRHSGAGAGVNALTPHRTSLALHTMQPRHVVAQGVISAGDSGAPVMTADGQAVGLVTDWGAFGPEPGERVNAWFGPRLDVAIEAAEAALGFPLQLATARLAR